MAVMMRVVSFVLCSSLFLLLGAFFVFSSLSVGYSVGLEKQSRQKPINGVGYRVDWRWPHNGLLGHESAINESRSPHRKLLLNAMVEEPNRMTGERCTNADIVINQGPTAPLPSGIPTYTVEIMNVCVTGCDISRIHLTCGWFSSAHLINPTVFKRLRFNDCLVNNGKPLVNGGTLSFQYANSFLYPLSVSSVTCH